MLIRIEALEGLWARRFGPSEGEEQQAQEEAEADMLERGLIGIPQDLLHDLNLQRPARLPGDMSEHLDRGLEFSPRGNRPKTGSA